MLKPRWFRLAAVLATVVALAACSDDEPDAETDDAMSAAVAAEVLTQVDVDDVDVECPVERDGASFECTATIAEQAVPVLVRADGDQIVSADLDAVVVDAEGLQAAAAVEAGTLLQQPATVQCGDTQVVVIPTNGTAECEVVAEDGTTGTAVITIGSSGLPTIVEIRSDED